MRRRIARCACRALMRRPPFALEPLDAPAALHTHCSALHARSASRSSTTHKLRAQGIMAAAAVAPAAPLRAPRASPHRSQASGSRPLGARLMLAAPGFSAQRRAVLAAATHKVGRSVVCRWCAASLRSSCARSPPRRPSSSFDAGHLQAAGRHRADHRLRRRPGGQGGCTEGGCMSPPAATCAVDPWRSPPPPSRCCLSTPLAAPPLRSTSWMRASRACCDGWEAGGRDQLLAAALAAPGAHVPPLLPPHCRSLCPPLVQPRTPASTCRTAAARAPAPPAPPAC